MSEKLDIFDVLKNIDNQNVDYFYEKTEAQQKTLAQLVMMRWLTGTKNKKQIKYVNAILNPLVFPLYKHPGLLYKLALTTTDTVKHYQWIGKKKKNSAFSNTIDVVCEYYGCSAAEAKTYLDLLTLDGVLSMADDLHIPKETITKVKNEFK